MPAPLCSNCGKPISGSTCQHCWDLISPKLAKPFGEMLPIYSTPNTATIFWCGGTMQLEHVTITESWRSALERGYAAG